MNDYIVMAKEDAAIQEGEPRDQHFMADSETPEILIPEAEQMKQHRKNQEREIKLAHQYNDTIHTLDPRYSQQITPVNGKLLVRAYVIDPVDENGVFVGFGHIYVPKKGNEYQSEPVPNPLPYQVRAVVVSSDNENYQAGQEVQLHPRVIQLKPFRGTEALICENMFARHDASFDFDNPYDHFGYLMVRPGDIECIIN